MPASAMADPNGLIITIAGHPGSGKSTVAKELALQLGLDHTSAGDFMRAMAAERHVTVLELSEIAETDDTVDLEIDERSRLLGESTTGLIIDARLAWHFIPHSVKVFLDVGVDQAAERIYAAQRASEMENLDLDATRRNIEQRAASEAKRYLDYYGLDYLDTSQYDLVIDTSRLNPEETVDEIVAYLRRRRLIG